MKIGAMRPSHAPHGAMVALTNEYAGSDGDMFSHGFKAYGLGPLIGVRTWGGVVGIWPRHALVDGTVTTQPEFSFWFEDVGFGVENYGTDPDIEVEIRPQDHAAGIDAIGMAEFPDKILELLVAGNQEPVDTVQVLQTVGAAIKGHGHRHAEVPGDDLCRLVVTSERPDHNPWTDAKVPLK